MKKMTEEAEEANAPTDSAHFHQSRDEVCPSNE